MPKEIFGRDYQFLDRQELLSFEEITRLVRVLQPLGVQKVRLTGGEPLVRRHLERLVEMLAGLGGLDLTLTTNGALLASNAHALVHAGLQRVTVSLDALEEDVFRRMNDVDFPAARVLAGIEAAAAAGLRPIKVNMVVKRGVNEDSIVPMARHFRGSGHILRFIEFMDVGQTNGWRMDDVVPAAEILGRVHAAFPLEAVEPNYAGEVAGRWRYLDGAGEVGVIARSRARSAAAAPGRGSRPTARSTPACSPPAAITCAMSCVRGPRTRTWPTPCAACGNGARIGIPRSARPRPNDCPRSKCPSSAAERSPSGWRSATVR
jgi:cyclic pyranopterin phosphate synthase